MHISFPDNLTERRVVLLSDQPDLLPKIAHGPVWMLATSYSDVEVYFATQFMMSNYTNNCIT